MKTLRSGDSRWLTKMMYKVDFFFLFWQWLDEEDDRIFHVLLKADKFPTVVAGIWGFPVAKNP